MANFDKITQSYVYLIEALDRHLLPRDTWSASCGEDNFTCGFWKMLHTASIGIAVHRGGIELIRSKLLGQHVEPISPLGAAEALRGFMGHFFPCTRCSQHFVERYDDCSNQHRCARLTDNAASATDADWKEFAKWLWEFHNTVSVDILTQELEDEKSQLEQEGMAPKRDHVETEAEVEKLWPSPALCLSCFNEDGSYDGEEVYSLLEETYWYVVCLTIMFLFNTHSTINVPGQDPI
jgi:Erv1 / Alr family